jgi:hypothetical protein
LVSEYCQRHKKLGAEGLVFMDYNKKKNRVLVVIPAFNEEKNVANVISSIRNLFPLMDILVVDDGSTDATPRIAKDAGAFVISLPFNLGYGAALQTGFKYALRRNYNYLIHLDADGQHEPESIRSLLREIQSGQADIVIGSRFLNNPNYRLDISKRIGIAIFRMIINLVIKQNITDPTSGFQALNRRTFEFYSCNYPSDFPDADVIITSHRACFNIKEIPVAMYKSPLGKRQMHSGVTSIYYVFKMLLSILVTLLRKRPEKEGQNVI